jgi:N-hydroxyarylamine O-acetyltransferase
MFEDPEAGLSPRMAEAYLRRIGIDAAPRTAGKAELDALIFAHQYHVPFENLDICDRRLDIDLATEKLFDKLVIRRRGGYCFELNSLFHKLLRALGFDARACLARVHSGRNFTPLPLHRITLVRLDGTLHFCDVGFGGLMPAEALPLAPGLRNDAAGGNFSLEENKRRWWTLLLHTGKPGGKTPGAEPAASAGEPVISFNTEELPEVYFIAPNYYCAHAPDSRFVTSRVVNLRIPGGSAQLFDKRFKVIRGGVVEEETTVESRRDLLALLNARFGINLPDETPA